MVSEKIQATERLGRNSKALCRGGGVRSSNEAAVMAVEQRGTVIQLRTENNCESRRIRRERASRMNREVHVRFFEILQVKPLRATRLSAKSLSDR